MAGHALIPRALFQARRWVRKLSLPPDLPGVSVLLVTWNRAQFLDLALRALADTVPDEHEILLWDNASTDDTQSVIAKWQAGRLNLISIRSPKNIGTNGFAELALRATREMIFEMDDDVFLLPQEWHAKLKRAFELFPEYAYLALDVLQDEFTSGAKPLLVHYERETRDDVTIEFGPTGGWATATPRKFYFSTEGYPYRPHKPYFPEDGYYNRIVRDAGKKAGILSGVKCYHASGPNWNAAFGKGTMHSQKMNSHGAGRSVGLTFRESSDQVPDPRILEDYRAQLCPNPWTK
ncbi:MAG: glycosyltransferase [Calditrichaeota bacterium]|nr:glycosyltransferase [Calditrichota bacterium]MCB9366032.1 glycosyltransferase [Calditrichota bacterium]MCB9391842.1 glycosyltransferase [Calditrichota bacterium]